MDPNQKHRRAAELVRELKLRRQSDPLLVAFAMLYATQQLFVRALQREKVAEGGNQSGKSFSACINFVLEAVGKHPTRRYTPAKPGENWRGWYATTTFDRFAEQAWGHFKSLLLFEGESVHQLPTRRIIQIGWNTTKPETPDYIKGRRDDGGIFEIWIKSYAQGREEFQAAEVDNLTLDEECPTDIYEEAQPRVLKRGGQIVVAATPVTGVKWLQDLRDQAETDKEHIFHCRFNTLDNPGLAPGALDGLRAKYKHRPDLFRLRVEGHPVVDEGRIYPDTVWSLPGRVVDPFVIPQDWTRYRCTDHGVHTVATLWAAVAPAGKKIAIYREYYGVDIHPSVEGNALNILRLSLIDGGERAFAERWIDPATLGAGQETGVRLIDLWNEAGYCSRCQKTTIVQGNPNRCGECGGERIRISVDPAPDNRVEPGIEKVKELLGETGPDGAPLLVVFKNLHHLFAERREYGRAEPNEKGDEDDRKRKPIKRKDHLLDCLRYLVAGGLVWKPRPRAPAPPAGSLARAFWEKRQQNGES